MHRLIFESHSGEFVLSNLILDVPNHIMYRKESDEMFAVKSDGYRNETLNSVPYGENGWEIYSPKQELVPDDIVRICTRTNGGYAYYYSITLTDAINTEGGQKLQIDSYY